MRNLLFILVLLLPSVCCGQQFNFVNGALEQYPELSPGSYIPLFENQAVLRYVVYPNGSIGSSSVVTSADILPNFTASPSIISSTLGWVQNDPENNTRIFYSVIDPTNIYYRTNSPSNTASASFLLSQIQDILASKGLGTVEQRLAYIASFKLSNVSLIDTSQIGQSIVEMLGPWAVAGLGLAIALFGIDLGTRSQKKLLGQAAKEARSAERKVINAQIRADGVAQAYRTRLSLLAQAKRGDIKLKGYSRFGARQAFYDTARDYADYKKSKGWTL